MSQAKQGSKRKRRTKAVRALGIAGVSLTMAGGASASTGGATANVPLQNPFPSHEIFLGEEEISDVSLGAFYVFDKENDSRASLGEKLAQRGCRGCRCGGCGRGCRCGGCGRGCGCWGGCGCGCCASWGGCRWC
jgi:hypothetical protein